MDALSRGRTPAAAAAAALALGILTASSGLFESHSPESLCALAAVLLAPPVVHLVYTRAGRLGAAVPAVLVDVSLVAALAVGGGALHEVQHRLVAASDVSNFAPADSLSVDVSVLEVRERPGRRPSAVGKVVQLADSDRATLAVGRRDTAPAASGLETGGRGLEERAARGASGVLWLSWPEGHVPPQRGELVRVTGALTRPRRARNPGSFDFERYLRSRGIRALLSVKTTERLRPARGAARAAAWVESTVRARLAGEPGALLVGLLLGKTSSIPDELLESFRRSGTVHVLAVSGLHVGFICLIAHALLRLFRVPPRPARLLILPCLVGFVALVGPRPSVVRASIMAAAFVIAWSLEKRPNPLNTVGLAAIAILVGRPGALSDLGFALSFGATAAIVTLFPMLRAPLSIACRIGRTGRLVVDSVALSVAAQLGVAPVLVASFGQVSIAAAVANVAVVPLAAFAVTSGMAMLATASVPSASRLFAAAAFAALKSAQAVSTLLSRVDAASLSVPNRLWPAFAAATFGLGLVAVTRRRHPGRRRPTLLACAAAAVSVLAIALTLSLNGPGRSHPRLVVFDVGQGDAILLEMPRLRRVLIDAGDAWGTPHGPDAGRDVVVPYLKAAGAGPLDVLAVTHAHRDHFGGALSVLTSCGAERLALGRRSAGDAALSELARAARHAGSHVYYVTQCETLLAAPLCTLVVVWPPGTSGTGATENERSIVIHARMPGVRLLLTGDIEARSERELTSQRVPLRADVLKVPHHGSATSSSVGFIGAVGPRLALVSVGAGNRYGHPDDAVLARLAGTGAEVMRTDRDGALVIDLLRGRVVATGFASGRKVVLRYSHPSTGDGPTATTER